MKYIYWISANIKRNSVGNNQYITTCKGKCFKKRTVYHIYVYIHMHGMCWVMMYNVFYTVGHGQMSEITAVKEN